MTNDVIRIETIFEYSSVAPQLPWKPGRYKMTGTLYIPYTISNIELDEDGRLSDYSDDIKIKLNWSGTSAIRLQVTEV